MLKLLAGCFKRSGAVPDEPPARVEQRPSGSSRLDVLQEFLLPDVARIVDSYAEQPPVAPQELTFGLDAATRARLQAQLTPVLEAQSPAFRSRIIDIALQGR